ncbi:MAG: penicillin-binding protein 1A [Bauldia sp.]|nr:penicillin-binding protein 1A [Bauldia sp.]
MFLRLVGYIFGIGTVLFLALAGALAWYISDISADVPSYEVLNSYAPPIMTRVHAADGQLVAEYARERRMYLPIQAIPERLKAAFLSAEDKNFYSHSGLDYIGLIRAGIANVESFIAGGGVAGGGSTITQQVAKNFLLTPDQTVERKIQEAILALRIETAFTKDQILELYMNDSNLGMGAYGVAAGALIYFNKSVQELTIAECAYLAALLKGPSNYHPFRFTDRAIERRNWVIDRMVENGYVTPDEGEAAKAEPLGVQPRVERPMVFNAVDFDGAFGPVFEEAYGDTIAALGGIPVRAADYFAEEVRRELLARYGEDQLYGGGLSVRTSLDPNLQIMARKALMDGLVAYDEGAGWRGPLQNIDVTGDWGPVLGEVPMLSDVFEWQLAVVLDVDGNGATIGLQPARDPAGGFVANRVTARIPDDEMDWAGNNPLDVGDVVYVQHVTGDEFRLRQRPEIEGALVAMNPQTGRVLAMVGGFSFSASQFNRATQAQRQPGSSFKPFVYAAALDNGYTPSSVIMDAPIEIEQQGGLGIWRPENYAQQFYGPSTLRIGIEQSRNVMTVRLAQDMGMPLVAEYAERFGVYDNLAPLLAMSLGSGETTVLRMVAGYAVFANGGRSVTPTLIDRIQDRYGNTIFEHDERICPECAPSAWTGQEEPTIVDNRAQVLDPMTAYQITSMMEGVVQRGTATSVRRVGHPIAGKTGTTNDYYDAWFIGYSTDLVVGVYMGFDTPRNLGFGNTGGVLSAPVFTEFMRVALADAPPVEFPVPAGMQLIPINRATGLMASAGADGTILEAFKPGTSPPTNFSIIGFVDAAGQPLVVDPNADRAVGLGQGGLY